MNDAAKEAMRSYKRDWQRRNKDKVKSYQERYWMKKAAERQEVNNEAEAAGN